MIMGLVGEFTPSGTGPRAWGLNAFSALHSPLASMGYSWKSALGAGVYSGFMFFLLSIFRFANGSSTAFPWRCARRLLLALPLLWALIALKNAGFSGRSPPRPLVALGRFSLQPAPILAALGFCDHRRPLHIAGNRRGDDWHFW